MGFPNFRGPHTLLGSEPDLENCAIEARVSRLYRECRLASKTAPHGVSIRRARLTRSSRFSRCEQFCSNTHQGRIIRSLADLFPRVGDLDESSSETIIVGPFHCVFRAREALASSPGPNSPGGIYESVETDPERWGEWDTSR